MKSIKLFLALIFISFQLIASENASSDLDLANEAYKSGDYTTAVKLYKQLHDDGYKTADLHYNLANTYYRLNEIGAAVLHFEKAALLNPRDQDIAYNLKVVKKTLPDQFEVISFFFVSRWWNNAQKIMSPAAWGILGLLVLWTGIAGIILWIKGENRKLRKQGFIVGISLIVLSTFPLALGFGAAKKQKNSKRAVIMVEQTKLKSAPDEVSEDIIKLHEGTTISILDEIGEWKKIRLSNGEEGWLETKILGLI